MPFQMIDRDQRLAAGMGQRLAGDQADHDTTDQPRPGRRGNGIHIGQRLAGQAAAFFLLIEPGGQGLLDDPVLGALQTLGNLIDTFGQLDRDVSGDGSGFGGSGHKGVLLCCEIRGAKLAQSWPASLTFAQ